ncbi:signal recognition particle subunit SRP19/SEC65 family protein [Methanoculleus bourgensis]|jgi:signal recognition particle subunit SRP19|uniref:Signal recognition particle 19 kDa protein n=1 Tax=Methanoculleus bourgensis TaxID=83986 RepID=A0A0X3BI93_9EURY|nr:MULTISPECIES: signal recognition particle subunit SRP19/SEC65 family protein [Methanoculleus]MBT0733919.1 signal recognition particle subunit SRP19/SEC65 family protein [Methanoculleus bourgensis]MDD3373345.1 signal recognition particle subunit SRP19/SEC65 family protein [Methanoculleus bourgensis]NMA87732.1 signal recognition particle protein Srp19 [Methanoculleus bourgensis]NQS79170.1 signal recognition particle protein Srp19 [Methanoculleus bourgensis]CVK31763.1 Signal recognition partic
MSAERILYPCYFDATLQRREGRRVPKELGVKSPDLPAIEAVLRKMKVPYRLEEHHHPARWAEREGRLVAEWEGSKEDLIRRVAKRLGDRK